MVAISILVSGLFHLAAAPATFAEFPFEFREGLLWVAVSASGVPRPLNFLLDTGAEVSVINLSTLRELGLRLAPKVRVRGVNALTSGYWPQKFSATVGGMPLPKACLALDLGEFSRSCASRVDGLLGADFVRDRVMQIDFETGRIRLLKVAEVRTDRKALPLETQASALRVPVRVNGGRPEWMRLDTGCAAALQWVTSGMLPAHCSCRLAIGLSQFSIPQSHTTVELGGHRFEQVPTDLHPQPIFPGEAGLLGNGLLSRFARVTIDAKGGRVWLEGRPLAEK